MTLIQTSMFFFLKRGMGEEVSPRLSRKSEARSEPYAPLRTRQIREKRKSRCVDILSIFLRVDPSKTHRDRELEETPTCQRNGDAGNESRSTKRLTDVETCVFRRKRLHASKGVEVKSNKRSSERIPPMGCRGRCCHHYQAVCGEILLARFNSRGRR